MKVTFIYHSSYLFGLDRGLIDGVITFVIDHRSCVKIGSPGHDVIDRRNPGIAQDNTLEVALQLSSLQSYGWKMNRPLIVRKLFALPNEVIDVLLSLYVVLLKCFNCHH